ncbi:MAG: efflux RND transporter permease subunit [Mucinivorans sp.]
MLNKIIQLSLRNRVVVMILAVVLLLWGSYTAARMEVDVFPDLTAPTVVVMTEASALPAEDVERLVTFPIETSLNGATDVRRVRSNSTTGFSVVTVEFDWGTDIFRARQTVAEKLASLSTELPAGVSAPIIAPQSSLLGEVLVLGLTSTGSTTMEQLRTLADWTLRPRLLSTGGVAQVTVVGGDIKEYQVNLNPLLMQSYDITLQQVEDALDGICSDGSGGVVDEWGSEFIVRAMVRSNKVEDLALTVVGLDSMGQPVQLGDVAKVTIGSHTPKMGDASVKMAPAVRLSITKQPATGTIELTQRLEKVINELRASLPPDVVLSEDIFRQETFIQSSLDNITKALAEGGVLVVLILMLFLGNWRTTIISLLAIPLSLLFSIIVLNMLGMSLNTMSLGGMAIAIGSLVDDAIIDVENVFHRLRENRGRRPALEVIYEASTEIRSAIWGATLIIMVTFLPLFFLGGMEGRMLQPLGVAFIVSLFASMVVAITLTPVLGSYLLASPKMLARHAGDVWAVRVLKKWYSRALEVALRHGKVVVGSAVALFVGALGLFFTLGHDFLPPFNEGSMAIAISSTPGISLDGSRQIASLAEAELMQIPEVVTVSRKTGRAELDEHALGTSTSEIDVPFVLKGRSREELFEDVRGRLGAIKGIAVEIGQPISHRIDLLLSGTRSNIAIKLFGPSLTELFRLGNQIKGAITGIEGLVDINVEQQVSRAELQIIPRREQLAAAGLRPGALANVVELALSGKVVGQVYEQGRNFDLVVKYDSLSSSTAAQIADMLVDSPSGKIPLGELAQVVPSSGPNAISRENVSRKIVVSGNVEGADLMGVVGQIEERVAQQVTLPQGYHVEYGGQAQSQSEASRTLLLTSLLAILVVFMLLYREFRSWRLAWVVMLNLPLALIGGVLTIALTSGVVSIPSIIGFISLFGIATRNGILLISHYEHLGAEPLRERVLKGSIDRISPIVMTALTSGLALVPLALGGSLPGNEIQSPMAIVLLGGLLSSTLLNLFVIPVVYSLTSKK